MGRYIDVNQVIAKKEKYKNTVKNKPCLLSDCRLNKRVTEIKTQMCPKVSAAYYGMDLPADREREKCAHW